MGKLNRYHTDIYWPDWFEKSIVEFTERLSNKQLVCSYHATKKYDSFSRDYQKIIRDLLATIKLELCNQYIFEFSATKETNEIKKVCYRFPTDSLRSDIIFVVSNKGKVVTIFLNKSSDPHINLDRSLYVKGE